jgi:glycosyltransferase involved in cell wall biosynthesis
MKVISIGLYNPIPIKSGVDSYITSLLTPLGKSNDVMHYYFFQSTDEKGHFSKERNFRTDYLKTDFAQKFMERHKFVQLLRPELLINKDPLKNITADLVLCDTFTFHAGSYVSKRNKSPLVLIKHNIEWKYLKSQGSKGYVFLKIYENYTLRKANAIITISESDYNYFSNYIDKEKIYFIPPKVNTDIFRLDGPEYDYGKNKFNLLFFGSLDRPMNIDALHFIKHRLIPQFKKIDLLDKIRVNIFGSGIPPESLKLKEDKDINYLGPVDDPGKYIRGADLVIIPVMNAGGMKIRILEILLCGKPVIITPETSIGLPDEFKEFVYIEKDAEGFLKTTMRFLNGTLANKINTTIIENYMSKSRTTNDVVNDLFKINKTILIENKR